MIQPDLQNLLIMLSHSATDAKRNVSRSLRLFFAKVQIILELPYFR